MARFKDTEENQMRFIAVSLKDQIRQGTFEWAVNRRIDLADLSLYEKKYNNDAKGAAAYPPKAPLKAVLFCYWRGIITSRKTGKACKENIIVKALAGDCGPDHSSIAAFIPSNSGEVRGLFAQVLFRCGGPKLITGEMFATDGRKPPSNAPKERSCKIAELRKKRDKPEKCIARVIQQHRETDKEEKTHPHGKAAKN